MNFKLLDIINVIAMFQLLVFVLFLVRTKKKKTSNRLLAIFLFIQIPIIFNFECFRFFSATISFSPHLFHIGEPFIFLAAPAFYLYVKSIAYSDFRITRKHAVHLLPFVLAVLYFTIIFYHHTAEEKRLLLSGPLRYTFSFQVLQRVAVYIQLLTYNIASIFALRYFQREIKQQYSSIQKINQSWLKYVLYGFLVAWISSAISSAAFYYLPGINGTVIFVNFACFFILFNYIFFKALNQPEIFSGVEEKQKYAFSKLTKEESEEYLSRLISYMEKEKPFLNPEINLKELSEQVFIPIRYLTQIINVHLQQNFYDFIAKYRIEEAQKVFLESPDKTVLEVLYQVGFNTKSSFNTAFKKFTGTTPSEFKKMN